MKPAPFKFLAPTSVEEALDALAEYGYDAKVLAGGQSLGVVFVSASKNRAPMPRS